MDEHDVIHAVVGSAATVKHTLSAAKSKAVVLPPSIVCGLPSRRLLRRCAPRNDIYPVVIASVATAPCCHCERSEAISSPARGLLRRCAPRNDIYPCCHCERSEAISFSVRGLLRRSAPRNDIYPCCHCERSEAISSPPWGCFVVSLLFVERSS